MADDKADKSKLTNDQCSSSSLPKIQSSTFPSQPKEIDSNHAASSSPIEIRQAEGGKFSVLSSNRLASPDGLMTDANGEPIPLDSIIKTANSMSSMMMAHKIALEDDFRLEPGMDISGPLMSLSPIIGSSPPKGTTSTPTEPNQQKVKDIMYEAYWDVFREEIEGHSSNDKEARKFDISKQLLRDIRQKIIDLLLPQHSRLKQDIEDKLDMQILDQLSKVESLNMKDYANYVLDLLSKLCAPVRDEKVRELAGTEDIVQVYRGIMELLELMRLDFANFTLNRFKPHIKAHSQEYEREKFNEILKQQQSIGIDGLEYTRIWLERAVKRVEELHGLSDLVNESSSIDNHHGQFDPTLIPSDNDTNVKQGTCHKKDKILESNIVNKVLNNAYCELLEWNSDKQKLYPETLLFDEATFKQLGEQYGILVLTSSILLTTFAFVSRFKLQDNNDFKVLVKSNVITLLTATYDESIPATSNETSKPSSSSLLLGDSLDQIKLETIASRLIEDIREKLEAINPSSLESFSEQKDLLRRQILDIQNQNNRVRELARRRILEFVETLLSLDVEHQQKKFSSRSPPPVNIPLGLNCLSDEITLTMAQLVKIIRYNRRVFFKHYEDIIAELVLKLL